MAGLSVGTVPPYYRDIFNILCPNNCSKVSKEIWMKCFKTSHLPPAVLSQIWDECDPTGSGNISRDGLYKSMALCALGQQGKGIEEKSLHNYGEAELPIPDLGDQEELIDIYKKVIRATRPTELGYSYEDLKSVDDISVTIMPEKKGMVFKHVEYLVESRAFKSSVRRRYRDFESFYEALVSKYPYRLVPRMPPKKMTPSSAFIEQRRRAFKRFTTLVVRHPVLASDEMVTYFLTAGGQEIGSRLKDKFKIAIDEYLFSPHAPNAEELVSESTLVKFERVCEQISLIQQIVTSMLQVAHNMENRSLALSHDMKALSANMSTLATHNLLMSTWTSGADETWSYMQTDCDILSAQFGEFADKAKQQGIRETSGFTESVHLFLDLITAYQDLCERREKTVQRKHQKALAKVHTMVNYKERVESTGRQLSEKDDSRIIKRDDELITIEKRNFFSLFCLDIEAQLVHINLAQLTEIFQHLVITQVKGHSEYSLSWETIKTTVDSMGRRGSRNPSATSSPNNSLTSSGIQGDSKQTPKQNATSPFV